MNIWGIAAVLGGVICLVLLIAKMVRNYGKTKSEIAVGKATRKIKRLNAEEKKAIIDWVVRTHGDGSGLHGRKVSWRAATGPDGELRMVRTDQDNESGGSTDGDDVSN